MLYASNPQIQTAIHKLVLIFSRASGVLGEQDGVLQEGGRLALTPSVFSKLNITTQERNDAIQGLDQALELESSRNERTRDENARGGWRPFGGKTIPRRGWREIDLDKFGSLVRNFGGDPHQLKGLNQSVQLKLWRPGDPPFGVSQSEERQGA
jgi:hypothetical protein